MRFDTRLSIANRFGIVVRSSAIRAHLPLLFIALLGPDAVAQTRIDHGGRGEQRESNHSFFKGASNGTGWQTRFFDYEVAQWMRDECPSYNVQVIVTTCFGGGFLDDFQAKQTLPSGNPAYDTFSFASAASWREYASQDGAGNPVGVGLEQFGPLTGNMPPQTLATYAQKLDGFTTAWWEDARLNSHQSQFGMLEHFEAARFGRLQDPINAINEVAPDPGIARGKAFPQYWSRNATSDTVTFFPPVGRKQYAVIVIGRRAHWHIEADVTQFYRMLRDVYNVPYENIVVLSPNHGVGSRLNCFPHGSTRWLPNAESNFGPGSIGAPGSPAAPACLSAL